MLFSNIFPVTCHTNHVGKGSTFVAIKGFKTSGIAYINKALDQGASRIIVQHDDYTDSLAQLCTRYNAQLETVDNTRQTLAYESSKALGNPSEKLTILAITGTKGKTTTTYVTEHLLRQAGYKTALISTIVNKILDVSEQSKNATPESDYLHMFFAECVKQDVKYVIMEISSHAIALHRIHGLSFTSIAFLNLMNDHLDFHENMDDYFATKMKLFSYIKKGGSIIVNSNHTWGEKALHKAYDMAKKKCANVISLSSSDMFENSAFITDVITSINGVSCTLNYNLNTTALETSALFGTFNAYNISIAALICLKNGISSEIITASLRNFQGVPGRLQHHVLKNGAHAFVDYAHNAGSTYEVLKELRNHTDHLIVIFGCGGEKDPGRRPGMGASSALFADIIIVTNDNPRNEDPQKIISDIIAGIPDEKRNKVICQLDRRKAIATGVALAQPTSIIALLGKGHENTYITQNQIVHFNDFEEICFY